MLVDETTGYQDEAWCYWYECGVCGKHHIMEGSNYCPNCGVKLEWKDD